MYDVKLTLNLGPAKAPVIFEWDDVTKLEIIEDLEEMLLKGLLKLNGMAVAVIDGMVPDSETTNPIEMVVEFLVTKDGAKWHRTLLEYPNMGEEQQAVFLGVLAGEVSGMERGMRNKAKAKAKGRKK